MKKLFKRSLLSILTLSTILSFSGFNNVKANERKPKIEVRSWPGRPGNPDGIGVETNVFNCKGYFKYTSSTSGEVRDLQRKRDLEAQKKNADASFILGISSGTLGLFIGPVGGVALGVGTTFISSYVFNFGDLSAVLPGDIYRLHKYTSENCVKDIIRFYYRNSDKILKEEKRVYRK